METITTGATNVNRSDNPARNTTHQVTWSILRADEPEQHWIRGFTNGHAAAEWVAGLLEDNEADRIEVCRGPWVAGLALTTRENAAAWESREKPVRN